MHLLVLVAALMLTAACTTAVPGEASAPTGVLLPPRPREVRLDGVDPCSLLTPEQRAGLGLEGDSIRTDPYVELFRGVVPTCTAIGFDPDPVGIAVGTVTSVGIERWQESDLAAEIRPTAVLGFPAVLAIPRRSSSYCSVEVDVAPGQLLDVQLSDGGGQPPLSLSALCTRATRTAEEAMRSLAAR